MWFNNFLQIQEIDYKYTKKRFKTNIDIKCIRYQLICK